MRLNNNGLIRRVPSRLCMACIVALAVGTVDAGAVYKEYGPITYDAADPGTQGGPYYVLGRNGGPAIDYTGDSLAITNYYTTTTPSANTEGHSLLYDLGFNVNAATYTVHTTHVSHTSGQERQGLLGYAVPGKGALGLWLYKSGYRYRYGLLEDPNPVGMPTTAPGSEHRLQVSDYLVAANQEPGGDGTLNFNSLGEFDVTLAIADSGNNDSSSFQYTLEQAGNTWLVEYAFSDILTACGNHANALDLIAAARDINTPTTFAFYTYGGHVEDQSHTTSFDNTWALAVPEPSSVALLVFGATGLAFGRRRRRRA